MKQCTALLCLLVVFSGVDAATLHAQPTLRERPEYNRYRERVALSGKLAQQGRVQGIQWSPDGRWLTFKRNGQPFYVDLQGDPAERRLEKGEPPASQSEETTPTAPRGRRPRVGRAQQATREVSPDGKRVALYRDFNVVIETVPKVEDPDKDEDAAKPKDEAKESAAKPSASDESLQTTQVTDGGSEFFRYGSGCWVYGEELSQQSAMWWSPDSRMLAFYEMDERHMQNYHLTTQNTELYTNLQTVRYPKAGSPNPIAGLLVYHVDSGKIIRVQVGGNLQQYIYSVRFSPDGKSLLFHRTNRRQDRLELVAADPHTGATKIVLTEQQDAWQNNRPLMRFLEDGDRFIWETEQTGWKQFELASLTDGRLHSLSGASLKYPVESLLKVDESAGLVYFTAYSDANPMNAHLHRANLDGSNHVRLTSQPLHHSYLNIAPNHEWFVATAESVQQAPITTLYDQDGQQALVLAETDPQLVEQLDQSAAELFAFPANDGKTQIYGTLHKPADFDPERTYPLVISVYGGPLSRGISNRYAPVNPYCEYGFIIAKIANRGTVGRGKAFETATYMQLGIVDIQDQADGVRYLSQRHYIDGSRVGIYGHSYGGYMSALAVTKFPGLFHVAVAGAPVTDWKNYDSIYTERFMRLPNENPSGYQDGSCLTYANQLEGRLLLMHGLLDDNVHPANTWQLVEKIQRANKRVDLMVYPNSKHGLARSSNDLRWEYLCRHLIDQPMKKAGQGTAISPAKGQADQADGKP